MPQGSLDEASRGLERPRDASRGIKEASKRHQRCLKEASMRPQDGSGRPQGCLKEAATRHREASRGIESHQRGIKYVSRRPQ